MLDTPPAASAKVALVVDDDDDVRQTVSECLRAEGLDVIEASNGLEALLAVKRRRPSIVVLDLAMPRLGGLDVLKRIKVFAPSTVVVVLTGVTESEVRRKALEIGAAAFLEKPLTLSDLRAVLDAGVGAASAPPPAPAPAAPPAPRPSRPVVLVVDDDTEHRETMEDLVREYGYETESAENAAIALRRITRDPPTVVLLDIDMPGLSGIDALPAIRAVAPDTSVIMVSGNASADIARGTLAHGAFDYVMKPVDPAHLRQVLNAAVAMTQITN